MTESPRERDIEVSTGEHKNPLFDLPDLCRECGSPCGPIERRICLSELEEW